MPEKDKIKTPKALDEMTKEEFEEKMKRSLARAKSGQGMPANDFLDRLASEIADASSEEQEEIWSELERLTEDDLAIVRTHSFKGVIALRAMQKVAEKSGISEMSLDEINAEIDAARRKRNR